MPEFFWLERPVSTASATSTRLKRLCDLCITNQRPIAHPLHAHKLVVRLATRRLKPNGSYEHGWICDSCGVTASSHLPPPPSMHHCVVGCSFDLCDACFWGHSASREQSIIALMQAVHVVNNNFFCIMIFLFAPVVLTIA